MRYLLTVATALLLLRCGPAGQQEKLTEQGLPSATKAVRDHDCRYCGMDTDAFAQFNASATGQQNDSLFFCSTRCLFLVHLDAKDEYPDLAALSVTDYYDQVDIDAKKAFYVIGSDVLGPMGPDLIPHRTEDAAQEFKRDHNGQEVLTYGAVDLATIQAMVGGDR